MIGSNDCGRNCTECDGTCQTFDHPINDTRKKYGLEPLTYDQIHGQTDRELRRLMVEQQEIHSLEPDSIIHNNTDDIEFSDCRPLFIFIILYIISAILCFHYS